MTNIYGLRLLAKPGVRRSIVALILGLVLLVRLGQFTYWTGQPQWGYDFSAYWSAAGHLLHGDPLYADLLLGAFAPQGQFLFLYPPPLAAALTPLAAIFPSDYSFAAWFWTGFEAAILVWSVLAIARVERLGECFPVLAGRGRWWLVGGALAFPPVVDELVVGNVHLVLLGLLTVAWLGLRRGDAPGERTAGIAVGVAAVIKVFPGLIVLWFLVTGRTRAAAWSGIAALVVVAASLPLTGLQPWLDYPAALANLSYTPQAIDALAPTAWLTPVLGFTVARIAVTSIGVLLLIVTARRADLRTGFALAIILSVLVTPALYTSYLSVLVLPLLLSLAARIRLRWLTVAYLLMWGGQQSAFGDLAWIVNKGLPTAGVLLLLMLLVGRLLGSSGHDDVRDREGAEDGLAGRREPDQGPAGAVVR